MSNIQEKQHVDLGIITGQHSLYLPLHTLGVLPSTGKATNTEKPLATKSDTALSRELLVEGGIQNHLSIIDRESLETGYHEGSSPLPWIT